MGYITIMLAENNRSQTEFTLLYFKIGHTVQQLEVENNNFIFIIYIYLYSDTGILYKFIPIAYFCFQNIL